MSRTGTGGRPPPTAAQQRAADPSRSVWVTASAGTGKTRVLADRVLRLLLAGVEAERILCLTFTKAAAAEMVSRIQDDLARFATARPEALRDELRDLLGRRPGAELELAPILLPRILDLPAGLPVMTIHAFCQSLLRRFPLEAGVAPHFEVLEPRDADDLLRTALNAVLEQPGSTLQRAIETLAVLVGEAGFRDGLEALRQNRLRLAQTLRRTGGLDGLLGRLAAVLEVDPAGSLDQLRREFCADAAVSPGLAAACRALGAGTLSGQDNAAAIAAWLQADLELRVESLARYQQIFLTKEGKPRVRLMANDLAGAVPAACESLQAEQQRLLDFLERCRAVEVFERSRGLVAVGAAVLDGYEGQKCARAALDYDDLIERALALLEQPGVAPWVQYKLDQRIDHLLVDEGQDTSPEQWAIVEAMTHDFFSGDSARPGARTLFVVGDEKQSIFGFMGADLETFQKVKARIGERARAARRAWHEEPLERSFRSVDAVLDVVDAVFAKGEARRGVVTGPDPLHHDTARAGLPGIVELWPLLETEKTSEPTHWELPDRPERADSPERRLARMIAGQIAGWVARAKPVPSTGRAIRPGDVMVLLPRRGLVQDLLIRELKRMGVPVAGADRLKLTEEIAVMDLMTLGDALLLPEDDLNLAAVLKSPLFGLNEYQLFTLAHDRGKRSLIERLRELAQGVPAFATAYQGFAALRSRADFMPPFELYARLLGEGGGRTRLLARLGPAALEPVEAFLAQALAYERAHPPSLQGFLHWLRADLTELVRDPDRPRDEVRVLTVHGAKGLEAPVVIIADAGFVPELKDRLLWRAEDGLPLWKASSKQRDPVSQAAYEAARAAQLDEQRRLLYVAMTRARDWLIIAGWRRQIERETNWYQLVEAGLDDLPEVVTVPMPPDAGEPGSIRRLERTRRQGELTLPPRPQAPPPTPPLPDWARRPAPPLPLLRSPLSPSRLAEAEPAADSPVDGQTGDRFRRGRVVHRLLQILPDLPVSRRTAAARRLLAQPTHRLPADLRTEILEEISRLLDDPALSLLFGPGSRAEVPIVGTIGGQPISGQIDRLVVLPDAVLLVDYKTNRTPPASAADVPPVYLRQLGAYRRLLGAVFPGRAVRCGLLWTTGPVLMFLDDVLLDRHLEEALGSLPPDAPRQAPADA